MSSSPFQDEFNFGRKARDEGIGRVVSHTPESYKIAVYQAAFRLCQLPRVFTVEDIRLIAGDPPNHVNALPGLMFGLVRSGLVKKVGDTRARRRKRHAGHIGFYVGAQWDIY